MKRRDFLMTASAAALALAAEMPLALAGAPSLSVPANTPDSPALTGYGESDFIAVLMGYVPVTEVKEVRLLHHRYDLYVKNGQMPPQLAELQPEVPRERLEMEYRAMLAYMVADGQIHDGAHLTLGAQLDSDFIRNFQAWNEVEIRGRVAFDERHAKWSACFDESGRRLS